MVGDRKVSFSPHLDLPLFNHSLKPSANKVGSVGVRAVKMFVIYFAKLNMALLADSLQIAK